MMSVLKPSILLLCAVLSGCALSGDKAREVSQKKAPATSKTLAKAPAVDKAWLDAAEQRVRKALTGSAFSVERRGEALAIIAPADRAFNPDRPAMLLPVSLRPLTQVAKLAAADPESAVLIVGHADSRGDAAANRLLSLERARSMAAIFRLSGLPGERLVMRGAGADQPRASNANAAGRAQNRRVELLLTMRSGLPTLLAQQQR
ncbi:OmpA family protein [Pseudomonas sp. NW5]|uniref:OmpA family protein n=1 Tax=Pseudomonas sp. NW5 TaxID=2934934 RepID=UPI00201FC217|nr:OmpA family protein [Pseudomonas sp. NW5]MCL7462048.1 OmpA family protein [Pseudomonas sp. NW5]